MRQTLNAGPLTATIRESWLLADNLRISADRPDWTMRPLIHAIIVESVHVEESHRRQGHLKRFLASMCADPRFDMVIVEGVGNQHLADHLLSEGWDVDSEVMDFCRSKQPLNEPEPILGEPSKPPQDLLRWISLNRA